MGAAGGAQKRIKSYVPKQMYFNVNDENVVTSEILNVETNSVQQISTSEHLSENG